jgi:outer membrane lipoprotein-sorting protein
MTIARRNILFLQPAYCCVAVVLLAAVSCLARAAEISAQAAPIVQQLEARYHGAHTLKAVFLERYSEGPTVDRVESGTAYFSRPGRMRWEYEEPEQKLFLSDGKTVWFYVPADHTVTRAPVKESSDWRTPLALLTGKADLEKLCARIEIAGDRRAAAPGDVVLRCVPRGAASGPGAAQASDAEPLSPGDTANIRDILLEVNPRDGWLESVLIRQAGDVEMEYRFGRWQENLALPEVLFHFVAPEGVAIVEQGSSGQRQP